MEYLINYLIICELLGAVAFAASGAIKAIKNSYDLLGIITIGTLTGVGGGIIRDVLCIQKPRVFMEEIYATAALVGSLTYYILVKMGFNYIFISIVSMSLVIGIRLMSIKWQWKLSRAN